jgi:hypothetical protein
MVLPPLKCFSVSLFSEYSPFQKLLVFLKYFFKMQFIHPATFSSTHILALSDAQGREREEAATTALFPTSQISAAAKSRFEKNVPFFMRCFDRMKNNFLSYESHVVDGGAIRYLPWV